MTYPRVLQVCELKTTHTLVLVCSHKIGIFCCFKMMNMILTLQLIASEASFEF